MQKLFGDRLKQLRDHAGLTQQELADRVGVESDSTVRRWERGTRFPSPTNILRLSQILGHPIRDLFTFPNHPDI